MVVVVLCTWVVGMCGYVHVIIICGAEPCTNYVWCWDLTCCFRPSNLRGSNLDENTLWGGVCRLLGPPKGAGTVVLPSPTTMERCVGYVEGVGEGYVGGG